MSGRRLAVVTGVVTVFAPLSQLAYVPVSVPIGAELGLGVGQVGLTVGVHAAASAVGSLALGPLLDLLPVRRVLPVALALNALASALLFFSSSLGYLVLGRVTTGLTSVVVLLCAYVLTSDAAPDHRARDRGFARLQTLQSVGAATALGSGAAAAGLGAPRAVFVALAAYAVGMLVVVLLVRLPRDVPADHAEQGVAGARAPATREALVSMRRLAVDRRLLLVMLAAVPIGAVMQGSHFGVSLLTDRIGDEIGPVLRTVVTVLIPAGVFLGSSVVRRLRRRARRVTLYWWLYAAMPVAVGLNAAAVALEVRLGVQAAALVLLGALMGALMPVSTAVSVALAPRLRGTSTSAEALSRSLGQALSPALVGVVAGVASVAAALGSLAGVCLLGLGAVAWVRRHPPGDGHDEGRDDDGREQAGDAADAPDGAEVPGPRPGAEVPGAEVPGAEVQGAEVSGPRPGTGR